MKNDTSLTTYMIRKAIKKLKKALANDDQRTINKLKAKYGDQIVEAYYNGEK